MELDEDFGRSKRLSPHFSDAITLITFFFVKISACLMLHLFVSLRQTVSCIALVAESIPSPPLLVELDEDFERSKRLSPHFSDTITLITFFFVKISACLMLHCVCITETDNLVYHT